MSDQPFGLWPSPISPKFLSQGLRLGDSAWDSDGQTLVWLEGRSDRGVLVASTLNGDAPRDLTDELSVRARVGYGGGDFCAGSGRVIFASGSRLYSLALSGGKPRAITPQFGEPAAPTLSPDGRWVLYVYSYERKDGVAVVSSSGDCWPQILACGRDFFMQPRWSSDGKQLAYIAWDHPNMPWDGCELFLADVTVPARGMPALKKEKKIAGGLDVAVFQPEFSPDGKYLSYLSDEGGWHNLYLHDLANGKTRRVTDESSAQVGNPAWVQGQRTYGWSHDGKCVYLVRNARGVSNLVACDIASGKCSPVKELAAYSDIQQPSFHPKKALIAAAVSSGTQSARIIVHDLRQRATTIVKRATSENISPENLNAPQPISWESEDGAEVHGLLYLPKNFVAQDALSLNPQSEIRNPQSKAPPAIIRIHGGPTSQTRAAFNADAQFFTTRGYALLDVNYRGSTGYGRDYMNALRGNWGIHDVEDAVSGAKHLARSGLADGEKLVIMGGSAGGFTVLQALVTRPGFFKAGLCLYGVSNMFTLAADTHKFEERYLDSLLGPLPEAAALYRERSPIFHAEKITDPIAIFQGEIDEVVPRAQSDTIVESLKRRNVPHEYHIYAGEGHGWRKTETIEKFYASLDGFLRTYVLFA